MNTKETAEVLAGFDMAMVAALPQPQDKPGIPSASELIEVIAKLYDTTEEEACQWLCARADDFEAWIPSIGSAAIA